MSAISDKRPNVRTHLTIILYFAALIWFAFFALFETSGATSNSALGPDRITRIDDRITNAVNISTLSIAAGLFFLSCASFFRRWLRWPIIGLLISVVAFPLSAFLNWGANLAPWTIHGQVQTTSGKQYAFCDSSFLQGQAMAIAEVERVAWHSTTYRVLVATNGDDPRSWTSIIRPAGSPDSYGQLYLCNNFLIGVRYENRCFLAYDLQKNQPHGRRGIESLPPFICLQPTDEPNPADIDRTCKQVADRAAYCMDSRDFDAAVRFVNGEATRGCPSLSSIQDAAATGPPNIAAAAAPLLACYEQAVERVRRRVEK
ncbi:MAG: hypothetical protein SF069_15255 [Phycisphaerae bacterium]|nr:hypothetical protein [Phycisphaerae bacterium]